MITDRIKLTKEQITKIFTEGYTEVLLPNGDMVVAKKEDLLFDPKEIDDIEDELNRQEALRIENLLLDALRGIKVTNRSVAYGAWAIFKQTMFNAGFEANEAKRLIERLTAVLIEEMGGSCDG